MATPDMLRDVLNLGSFSNKKVDYDQAYITTTDIKLMKANGWEVDRVLEKNTVFKIGEAPEEYHDTLEGIVKSNMVETYQEESPESYLSQTLEKGLRKVETPRTIAESVGDESLEDSPTVTVPTVIDGKSVIRLTKRDKKARLESLKRKLRKR